MGKDKKGLSFLFDLCTVLLGCWESAEILFDSAMEFIPISPSEHTEHTRPCISDEFWSFHDLIDFWRSGFCFSSLLSEQN